MELDLKDKTIKKVEYRAGFIELHFTDGSSINFLAINSTLRVEYNKIIKINL